MTDRRNIEGHCLCGAVSVAATVENPVLTACHCDMCRRHSSSVFMAITCEQPITKAEGPIKVFRSSEWAERGFCGECGSTLWYSPLHDGARYLAAGLFENAGGAKLGFEYFSDNCPQGYELAGDHTKMTTQETIAYFTGEAPEGKSGD